MPETNSRVSDAGSSIASSANSSKQEPESQTLPGGEEELTGVEAGASAVLYSVCGVLRTGNIHGFHVCLSGMHIQLAISA
jgi:hypothetical protein